MGKAASSVEAGYANGRNNFADGLTRRFALREMPQIGGWTAQLAVLLALGAVFGWIGPFGTFQDLGIISRLAYWVPAMLLIGSISHFAMEALRRFGPSAAWPPVPQAIASALIVAVPGVAVVFGMEAVFRHSPPLAAGVVAQIYFSVALVLAAIGIPWAVIRARQTALPRLRPVAAPPVTASSPNGSPFLRRVSPRLGTDLISIATEDHYLRVTTALGHELILFRLSDAVAELDPGLGQQVHRSYWVARRAVSGVERVGHRTTLVLINGAKVPVSRTHLPALRAAGWLDDAGERRSVATGNGSVDRGLA